MRPLALLLLAVPLALAGALPAHGSLGAVNGRIAFVRTGFFAGPETEVWTMNQDGSDFRRVGIGGDPAWSPDGTRLVLVEGGTQLVVVRPDGGRERELAVEAGPTRISSPAWSPDGGAIAFGGENPSGLYVVPSAGGTARLLAPGFSLAPAWSPDGRIAFVGVDGTINVIDPDGSGATRLPGVRGAPSTRVGWSPDGTRIAFGDYETGGISIVGLTGGAPVAVAEGFASQAANPAWSPDGKRIAFDNGDICVVGSDGSGVGRLTYGPYDEVYGQGSGNGRPAWQPLPAGTGPAGSTATPNGPALGWDRNFSWPWACSLEYAGRSVTGLATPRRAKAGGVVTYSVRLTNGGDVPIGEREFAALYASLDGGARVLSVASSQGSCSAGTGGEAPQVDINCHFGALFPGETAGATLRVRAAAPGEVTLTVYLPVPAVVGDNMSEPDLAMRTRIAGCTSRGTATSDVIRGTGAADVLCGLDGNDRIRAGPGRDSIYAGPGNDTVFTRDGRRDIVSCGSGRDRVIGDRTDRVQSDCENVHA
jgi:RTX calcium-binding nonapeptide repeat (4 copies)/WD40-like Beta Propeller Repeat